MTNKELTAAITLGAASMTIFNILPVYLGAVAETLQLTADKVGFLASIEPVTLALIAALGPFWIRLCNWRKLAAFSLSVLIAGNGLCMLVESYQSLVIIRLVTGIFGSGLGYALAIAMVAEADKPDRVFGLAIVVFVIIGAIGLYLLPYFTLEYGMDAPFLFLVLPGLLCFPMLKWCPQHSRKQILAESSPAVAFPLYLPVLGLAVHAIWYLNVGAFWAFVERIGNHAGLGGTDIGLALTIGMLTGLSGAVLAAVFNDRFGRVWPLAATLVIHVMVMAVLLGDVTGTRLTIIVSVYNISWNFGLAYMLGLIATADSRGRLAVLIPVAQGMGIGGGPAIAGLIAVQHGYHVIALFAITCCLVALCIYYPFALRVVRQNRSEPG